MRRKELERKINDAAEGLLNATKIRKLEEALQQHPDLLQNYRDITSLPDLSKAYGKDLDAHRNDLKVHQIKKEIDRVWEQPSSFEEISIVWFRRYALAASLFIFALTSLFYVMAPEFGAGDEMTLDEFFYSYEESSADDYVFYLDEWIEQ